MIKLFACFGAFFAALGVVLGAFGAHALKTRISPDQLGIFEVGVRYQMYHALGLLALASFYREHWLFSYAGFCLVLGIILFSGSLYVLSLTGIKSFGAVTPIGGLLFVLAWIFFFAGLWLK